MKKLLFIALLFVVKNSVAQKDTTGLNIPVKDGRVVYEGVFEAPGKSKETLSLNAKLWFVGYFKTINDVTRENKDDGTVIGIGTTVVPFKGMLGNTVLYSDQLTIMFDCKDNRYKVKIYNQELTSPPTDYGRVVTTPEMLVGKLLGKERSPFNVKQARRMLESMDETIMSILGDLKKSI